MIAWFMPVASGVWCPTPPTVLAAVIANKLMCHGLVVRKRKMEARKVQDHSSLKSRFTDAIKARLKRQNPVPNRYHNSTPISARRIQLRCS